MIDINTDILDEITRYETDDDLSPATKSRIAEKIATDEAYKQHLAYYQTIIGALARDEGSSPSHASSASPEDDAYFDDLIEKDRRKTQSYRIAYIAGLLVLSVAFFFIGRFSNPAPDETSALLSDIPIANVDEPEEEPLSAAGNAILLKATKKDLSLSQTQVLLSTHADPDIQYLYSTNRLRLFVPSEQQSEFSSARLEIITLEKNETSKDYLNINDQYYPIQTTSEKQTLIPLKDENILQEIR